MIYKQIWVEENINPSLMTQDELNRLWVEARQKGLTLDSSSRYQLFVDDSDNVSVIPFNLDLDFCFRYNGFMFYDDTNEWKVIR